MKYIHYIIALLIIATAQFCNTKLQIAFTGVGIIGLINALAIGIFEKLYEIKDTLNKIKEND